jgi:AraC family transcriptional regulator
MAETYVPLTTGSDEAVITNTSAFTVTDVHFPPSSTLPLHLHERTIFAVILAGSFDGVFPGKRLPCEPGTVLTEPAGEKHGNRFGQHGARVLVLEADPARTDLFQPCGRLLERISHFRHPGIARFASDLAYELRHPDSISHLAVEGLGLEMLAEAARTTSPRSPSPPRWLRRAEELLHDRFLDATSVDEIAKEVGVHPVHLARVFRRYHGTSLGSFVRRLRLDWAAARLSLTDEPLAAIAWMSGFADQSHFTRAFKKHTGETPGNYRRAHSA